MLNMEITIKYTKTGNKFKITPEIELGTNVYDLVTVLDSFSDSLKNLTGKHLTDHHPGLNENEKFELAKDLKIEDLR